MMQGDILNVIFLLCILAFMIFAYFSSNKDHWQSAKTLGAWILVFFILIVVYAFRFELVEFKNRILAVLVPSYSWSEKPGQLTIARHQNGHFYVYGYSEDNQKVEFLIDTGATNIALSLADAIKLGVNVSSLRYTQRYNTANGVNYGAPVIIRELRIGQKTFYNVRAHVIAQGLDTSLLGMSILDDFKDFQITRDLLILRY